MNDHSTSHDEVDVIIVGLGIAGLFAALTAADAGLRPLLLTKGNLEQSNTFHAQGGIAAALGNSDTPALHREDTLKCGAELNDWDAADIVTREGIDCVEQLYDLGIPFDREDGHIALGREAAHSMARVVHAGGDATGRFVQQGLLAQLRDRRVEVVERAFVSEILLSGARAVGVKVIFGNGLTRSLFAPRVILATGGAGQLYARTTNPSVATGDGIALAYRAGAHLTDLEFFQFHPTALALPGRPAFLISEAARGEGGILRDQWGRAIMRDYHRDAELAPRDIVSRAIWTELNRASSAGVFLDLTSLGHEFLRHRFPTIWAECEQSGIDISTTPIPVAPAAHYFMGGIDTDLEGRTSIPGLFATGEAACTRLHGANRLASNSLLEGLVFGRRAALAGDSVRTSTFDGESLFIESYEKNAEERPRELLGRSQLQELNWSDLGLVRTQRGMSEVVGRMGSAERPTAGTVRQCEDENLRLISGLIAKTALLRRESRGAHYRSDFPYTDDEWRGHIVVSKGEGAFFQPQAAMISETVPA